MTLAAFGAQRFAGFSARPAARRIAGFALLILPVSFHNFAQTGRWVWISTNDGINFYIGNSAGWPAPLTDMPGTDWDALVRQPFLDGAAKNDADASRWFRRKTLEEIRSDLPSAAKRRRWDEGSLRGTTQLKAPKRFHFQCRITAAAVGD